jgi:5'-nucleotidase
VPLAPDPKVEAIVEHYRKLAAPLAQQPAGRIAGDFDRRASAGGDSALGRLIADAQLAVTRSQGAQLAFTNPGGLRANLRASAGDSVVTYADAFASQPFGNTLVTLTLTGAQLKQMLEQQWSATKPERARFLQPSHGFSYAWRANGSHGERIVADSMRLDGRAIELDRTYRVTVNNFLADGGDGFRALREGIERVGGPVDVDALTEYLREASKVRPLAPDRAPRIRRNSARKQTSQVR